MYDCSYLAIDLLIFPLKTTPADAATPEKLPTPPPSPVEVEEHFEVKKISPDTVTILSRPDFPPVYVWPNPVSLLIYWFQSDKVAGESAKHDENVSFYAHQSALSM